MFMFKKINLIAILFALFTSGSIFAQKGFEAAASSSLTEISLPANALRISPENVPAEITQTLDKFVAAGEGKFQKGNSEVLAWSGGKQTTISRLMDSMKAGGWQYEIGGTENGITIFSLLKDGAKRRAIMGFYGESDGTLVLAWVEILSNDAAQTSASNDEQESDIKVTNGAFNSIVGTWDNGRVSTVNRQNTVTGAVAPSGGTRFEYQFAANGKFSFTGLANTSTYGLYARRFDFDAESEQKLLAQNQHLRSEFGKKLHFDQRGLSGFFQDE
jgi:hypothetical protein